MSTVKDPFCGMPVTPETTPHSVMYDGQKQYFCSAGCAAKFKADPEKYIQAAASGQNKPAAAQAPAAATVNDPVCGMPVNPTVAPQHVNEQGKDYYFCSAGCAATFKADPQKYTQITG